MSRVRLPLQRRDFEPGGDPHHVVWWRTQEIFAWGCPWNWLDLSTEEQARELGGYVCRSSSRACVEVRICWHHHFRKVMVDVYAETSRQTGRHTQAYTFHADLSSAVLHAQTEVRRLHRWLESDGTDHAPAQQIHGVRLPPETQTSLTRRVQHLEAQQQRLRVQSGTGSKAGRAARVARLDEIGQRLHIIRSQLLEMQASS